MYSMDSKEELNVWKVGLSIEQHQKVTELETSLYAAAVKLSEHQLLIRDLQMTRGEDVVKELRHRIQDLEAELGEKEDQTRDLEVKLFEVSFTSTDPDFSAINSPPSSSSCSSPSLLPLQPPLLRGSVEFGLPSSKTSTSQTSSQQSNLATPSSRRNTISTVHSSGIPKPGTSKLSFRPSAKTRPDQTSFGIAGAMATPQPPPAIHTSKFGFGAGRQSLGVLGGKPVRGAGMVGGGQVVDFGKMAKLEFELKEKTAELVGLKVKLGAAKEKCLGMDKMTLALEREKEKAAGLFSRLSTLQSDSQCKLANAESARMNLETKFKEQERDLKSELTSKSFEVLVKTKETDNAKEQLVKLHEQAKVNIENLAFLDLEKSLVKEECSRLKAETEINRAELDLISAEAAHLNQAGISIREENNKLAACKHDLEKSLIGSRMTVVKLQSEVDSLSLELKIKKVEQDKTIHESKLLEVASIEAMKNLEDKNTELNSHKLKVREQERSLQEIKKSEEMVNDTLKTLQEENSALTVKVSTVCDEKKIVEEEMQKLEETSKEFLKICQEENSELKCNILALEQEKVVKVSDLSSKLREASNDLRRMEEQRSDFERRLKVTEAEFICKEVLLVEMIIKVGETSDELLKVTSRKDKLESEKRILNEEVRNSLDSYALLEVQYKEAVFHSNIMEKKCHTIYKEKEETFSKLQKAKATIEDMKVEVQAGSYLVVAQKADLKTLLKMSQEKLAVEQKICSQTKDNLTKCEIELEYFKVSIDEFQQLKVKNKRRLNAAMKEEFHQLAMVDQNNVLIARLESEVDQWKIVGQGQTANFAKISQKLVMAENDLKNEHQIKANLQNELTEVQTSVSSMTEILLKLEEETKLAEEQSLKLEESQQGLKRLDDQLKKCEQKLHEVEETAGVLTAKLDSSEALLSLKLEEISNLTRAGNERIVECEAHKKGNLILDIKVASLNEKLVEVIYVTEVLTCNLRNSETEKMRMNEKFEVYVENKKEVGSDLKTCQEDNQFLKGELDTLNVMVESLTKGKLNLQSTLTVLQKQLANECNVKSKLVLELEYLKENVVNFKEEQERAHVDVRECNNKIEGLECEVIVKNCKVEEMTQEVVQALDMTACLLSQLEDQEKLLTESSSKLRKTKEENWKLHENLIQKDDTLENLSVSKVVLSTALGALEDNWCTKLEEERKLSVELEYLKENIERFKLEQLVAREKIQEHERNLKMQNKEIFDKENVLKEVYLANVEVASLVNKLEEKEKIIETIQQEKNILECLKSNNIALEVKVKSLAQDISVKSEEHRKCSLELLHLKGSLQGFKDGQQLQNKKDQEDLFIIEAQRNELIEKNCFIEVMGQQLLKAESEVASERKATISLLKQLEDHEKQMSDLKSKIDGKVIDVFEDEILRNLTQINVALESQIKSQENETGKSGENNKIQVELQHLKENIIIFKSDKLESEEKILEFKTKLDAQRKEIIQVQADGVVLENKLKYLEEKIAAKSAEREQYSVELLDLKENLKGFRDGKLVSDERILKLNDQLDQDNKELTELKSKIEDLTIDVIEAENKVSIEKNEKIILNKQLEENDTLLTELNFKFDGKSLEICCLLDKIGLKTSEAQDIKEEKLRLEMKINDLEESVAFHLEEIKKSSIELNHMKANIQNFKDEQYLEKHENQKLLSNLGTQQLEMGEQKCKIDESAQELLEVQIYLRESKKLFVDSSEMIKYKESEMFKLQEVIVQNGRFIVCLTEEKVTLDMKIKSLEMVASVQNEEAKKNFTELQHLKDNIKGFKDEQERFEVKTKLHEERIVIISQELEAKTLRLAELDNLLATQSYETNNFKTLELENVKNLAINLKLNLDKKEGDLSLSAAKIKELEDIQDQKCNSLKEQQLMCERLNEELSISGAEVLQFKAEISRINIDLLAESKEMESMRNENDNLKYESSVAEQVFTIEKQELLTDNRELKSQLETLNFEAKISIDSLEKEILKNEAKIKVEFENKMLEGKIDFDDMKAENTTLESRLLEQKMQHEMFCAKREILMDSLVLEKKTVVEEERQVTIELQYLKENYQSFKDDQNVCEGLILELKEQNKELSQELASVKQLLLTSTVSNSELASVKESLAVNLNRMEVDNVELLDELGRSMKVALDFELKFVDSKEKQHILLQEQQTLCENLTEELNKSERLLQINEKLLLKSEEIKHQADELNTEVQELKNQIYIKDKYLSCLTEEKAGLERSVVQLKESLSVSLENERKLKSELDLLRENILCFKVQQEFSKIDIEKLNKETHSLEIKVHNKTNYEDEIKERLLLKENELLGLELDQVEKQKNINLLSTELDRKTVDVKDLNIKLANLELQLKEEIEAGIKKFSQKDSEFSKFQAEVKKEIEAKENVLSELADKERSLSELSLEIATIQSNTSIMDEQFAQKVSLYELKIEDLQQKNEESNEEYRKKVMKEKEADIDLTNKCMEISDLKNRLEVDSKVKVEINEKYEKLIKSMEEMVDVNEKQEVKLNELTKLKLSTEQVLRGCVTELEEKSVAMMDELLNVKANRDNLISNLKEKDYSLVDVEHNLSQSLIQNTTLVKEIAVKMEALEVLEKDLNIWKRSFEKSLSEVENLNQEISKNAEFSRAKDEKMQEKINIIEKLESDLLSRRTDVQERKEELVLKDKDIQKLKEECLGLGDNVRKLCSDNEEVVSSFKVKNELLNSVEKENVEKENEIIEMGEKLQDVISENDRLKKFKVQFEASLEKKQLEMKEMQVSGDKILKDLIEKELLYTTLAVQIDTSNSKLEELENKVMAVERREKSLGEQLELSCQEKLKLEESLKLGTCKFDKICHELKQLTEENKEKFDFLEKVKESTDEELKNLRASQENLRCENAILTNDNSKLDKKLESVCDIQPKLEEEVEILRSQLAEATQQHEENLSEEKSQVKNQFDGMQSIFNRQKKELEFQVSELQTSLQKTSQEFTQCKVEKLKLDSQVSKAKKDLDDKITEHNYLNNTSTEEKLLKESELEKLRIENEELQLVSKAAEDGVIEKQILRTHNLDLQSQLESVKSETKNSIDGLEREKEKIGAEIHSIKLELKDKNVEFDALVDSMKKEKIILETQRNDQKLQHELTYSELEEIKLIKVKVESEFSSKIESMEKENSDLVANSSRMCDEIKENLMKATTANNILNDEKNSIKLELDKSLEMVKEYVTINKQLESEKSDAKALGESSQAELESLKAEKVKFVQSLNEKETLKDQEIKSLEVELKSYKTSCLVLETEKSKLGGEAGDLAKEVADKESKIIEKASLIEKLQKSNEEMKITHKLEINKTEEDLKIMEVKVYNHEQEFKITQVQMQSNNTELEQVKVEKALSDCKVDSLASDNEGLTNIKKALEKEKAFLNGKLDKSNTALDKSELLKDSLLAEIKTLQFQKANCEKGFVAKLADLEKMKVLVDEMEDVKKKLQFSVSNAKRLEKDHETIEALLVASEEEKATLKTSSARLMKQLEILRQDVDRFAREAEQASSCPWTSEEWEGLTNLEIFNILKGELVPAQQSRLATLALEDLEKDLAESKKDFMKIVDKMQEIKEEKVKLEAKVCFLENVQSSSGKDKSLLQDGVVKESISLTHMPAPRQTGISKPSDKQSSQATSMMAHSKLTKSSKKDIPGVRPFTPKSNKTVSKLSRSSSNKSLNSSSTNIAEKPESSCSSSNASLRRSSRSASKIANLSLCRTTHSTESHPIEASSPTNSLTCVSTRRLVPLPSAWVRDGVVKESPGSNSSHMDNSAFSSSQQKRSCSTSSQEVEVESDKKKPRSDSASPAKNVRSARSSANLIRPSKLSTAPAPEEDTLEASEEGSEVGSVRISRALRSKGGKGRKPEDCKQQ